jgi:hypothetical protein
MPLVPAFKVCSFSESLPLFLPANDFRIKVFLDDTGNLPQIRGTKAVVNELQAELSRSESLFPMGKRRGTLLL